MTLEAVIFDVGGTLLHYHDPHSQDPKRHFRRITIKGFRAVLQRLVKLGFDLPDQADMAAVLDAQIREKYRADLENLRGGSIEEPMRAALAEVGVELSNKQWGQVRDAFFDTIDEIVTVRKGAQQTLQTLEDSGYVLGLISNTYWASHMHDRHLADYGLLEYLPVRVYSCDAPYMKPHPGIFKLALVGLGVALEHAVYVGDRLDVDVQGAQKVGMKAVLIESPYRSREIDGPPPEGVEPDATIKELPELPAALSRLQEHAQ